MGDRHFDDLARALAEPMQRRRALRLLGGAIAAAALPGFKPKAAGATTPQGCGNPDLCPKGSKVCGEAGKMGCNAVCIGPNDPEGTVCCASYKYGSIACPPGYTCNNNNRGEDPCKCAGTVKADGSCKQCPSGQRHCGTECCPQGEICCDEREGRCRAPCARGQALCGCNCCAQNEACLAGVCKSCPPARKCGDHCCEEHQKCCPEDGTCYDPKVKCCTPSGVRNKFQIEKLEDCPNRVARPDHQATVNGCGPEKGIVQVPDTFGNANFKSGCDEHDRCYERCRTPQAVCDQALYNAMLVECRRAYPGGEEQSAACRTRARLYFDGIRTLGSGPWERAQKKGCQCCQ